MSLPLPDSTALIRVGLIGAGILHSRSPALHMDEAAAAGIALRYDLFDLDQRREGAHALASLLDAAQRQGYAGLNITYPCKQTVLEMLDDLSPEARALQAVNTVIFKDGRRTGHNTDWWGFAESFRRGLPDVPRDHVLQLGAGGAGAAVAYASSQLGVRRLTLIDRDRARAEALAARLAIIAPGMHTAVATRAEDVIANVDGLIHATPTGMKKSPGIAVAAQYLRADLWVAEVVYLPLLTQLLAAARRANCRTLDGGGMAIFQAVAAFRLFIGLEPDAERMRRSFLAKLASESAHGPGD